MRMTRRARLALLTLGGLGAATAALARPAAARRAAVSAVPAGLRSPVCWLPLPFTPAAVRVMRALPQPAAPVRDGVTVDERTVQAGAGRTPVRVHVYEPAGRARPSGAVVWTHGGGYVIGDPVGYHDVCSRLADELGVLVVSVDYRLAPEHPFPAGLEDAYTALLWLHESASELGVDRDAVAVAGDSAGGGLAAALAQAATDRGEAPVCFQALVYPMLDDRTVLREEHGGRGALVWTAASNRFGWTSYLGSAPSHDRAPEYASPSRRDDLGGLPPAWIGVGDLDLFLEEDVDYAERLEAAGVPCELVVVPGMYHAADRFRADDPRMVGFSRSMVDALGRGLLRPAHGRTP
jgi:acetyl esterase/lipase